MYPCIYIYTYFLFKTENPHPNSKNGRGSGYILNLGSYQYFRLCLKKSQNISTRIRKYQNICLCMLKHTDVYIESDRHTQNNISLPYTHEQHHNPHSNFNIFRNPSKKKSTNGKCMLIFIALFILYNLKNAWPTAQRRVRPRTSWFVSSMHRFLR